MTFGGTIRLPVVLLMLPLMSMSCVKLAERLAAELADRSLKHSTTFHLIEGDLARYRQCLKTPAGSCRNDVRKALPQAEPATPASFAPSSQLKSSLNRLAEGHPARAAAGALENPILEAAAVMHQHLRGQEVQASPDCKVTAAGGDSTIHMNVSIAQASRLVEDVHRSTIPGGWDALVDLASGQLA